MIVQFLAGAALLAMAAPVAAQTVPPSAPAPSQAASSQAAPSGPAPRKPVPALPGVRPSPKPEGPAEVSRNAPVNGVLTLFGNERCPTDDSGAEVVVCVRANAAEQFRIPKDMREFKITPENQSWAVRAQGLVNDPTVSGGVGSCSTVGPGGQSGCFLKQAEDTRRANQARKADQKALEDALP